MVKFQLLLGLVLVGSLSAVVAQKDTKHHRDVYQEINDAVGGMRMHTATYKPCDAVLELKGWKNDGGFRKIVATEKASFVTTEYYLENEKPLFVFLSGRNAKGKFVEERIYFQEGKIFKWLSNDPKAPVFHAEDYEATTEMHLRFCDEYLKALQPDEAKSLVGRFLGIEEGDYFHWQMKLSDGSERSFFVLRPTDAMKAAMDDPEKYHGKKCKVLWKSSVVEIPEAGGKMEIEQIVGVEWLK